MAKRSWLTALLLIAALSLIGTGIVRSTTADESEVAPGLPESEMAPAAPEDEIDPAAIINIIPAAPQLDFAPGTPQFESVPAAVNTPTAVPFEPVRTEQFVPQESDLLVPIATRPAGDAAQTQVDPSRPKSRVVPWQTSQDVQSVRFDESAASAANSQPPLIGEAEDTPYEFPPQADAAAMAFGGQDAGWVNSGDFWSVCGGCSRPRRGIHCHACTNHGDDDDDDDCKIEWDDAWLLPWEVFAQGDYIGPARLPHVPEYRLRVDDQIEFVFRITGKTSASPYKVNVGDTLRVESLTDETVDRNVIVQRDGTVTLGQIGQIPAAGRDLDELRIDIEEKLKQYVQNPSITVSPIETNRTIEELRATVDGRFGSGGQSRTTRVTPEGTIQLPAIGSVPAHGLTLSELGREINFRYAGIVDGIEVTPILLQRAPRYVYVLGEVRTPGRYTLEAPTSLMQAIALAGGWNVGANTWDVVVFRRDANWCLMATKVSLRKPLYGKDPCPEGEMWLQDSDLVIVPKAGIKVANEFIEMVFTRGVYGVFPFSTSVNLVRDLSSVAPILIP